MNVALFILGFAIWGFGGIGLDILGYNKNSTVMGIWGWIGFLFVPLYIFFYAREQKIRLSP